jgi:hypothetical protein
LLHGRVDWRSTHTRALLILAWLHRVLGQTGTWDDTLLRAVHANAERPPVIVLVEHADQLTGAKTELVRHGGLEVELDTVDIVGCLSWAIGRTACDGDWQRSGWGWSWRGGNVVSPSWARWDAVMVRLYARGRRKSGHQRGRVRSFSSRNSRTRVSKVWAGVLRSDRADWGGCVRGFAR